MEPEPPRRPRAGETEEDILAQQAALLAGRDAPAATLAPAHNDAPGPPRVRRRGEPASAPSPATATRTRTTTQATTTAPAPRPAGPPRPQSVMGGVRERSVRAASVEIPPAPVQVPLGVMRLGAAPAAPPTAQRAGRAGARSIFAQRFDSQMGKPAPAPTPTATPTPTHTPTPTPTPSSATAPVLGLDPAAMAPEEVAGHLDSVRSLFSADQWEFLRRRKQQRQAEVAPGTQQPTPSPTPPAAAQAAAQAAAPVAGGRVLQRGHLETTAGPAPDPPVDAESGETEEAAVISVGADWVNMDVVETDKLAWMGDLPPAAAALTADSEDHPIRSRQVRFGPTGDVIAPGTELPTHLGLHHHGDQPAAAGYTLAELSTWIRSSVPSQRVFSLEVLAHILRRAWPGGYDEVGFGTGQEGRASGESDSILECLMDMGLPLLLRLALDEKQLSVIAAAAQTIAALVVYPRDEALLDALFCKASGFQQSPMCPPERPSTQGEEEEQPEDDADRDEAARQRDIRNCQRDLIAGLLGMDLLPRVRYLLEVQRLTPAYNALLDILLRVARHGLSSATAVASCPRLLSTVRELFLRQGSTDLAEACESDELAASLKWKALKLVRLLCQAGRTLAGQATDQLMTPLVAVIADWASAGEGSGWGCRHAAEAYNIWQLCLRYGLHCQLAETLFPIVIAHLRSMVKRCSQPSPEVLPVDVALLCALEALAVCAAHPDSTTPPHAIHWDYMGSLHPLAVLLLDGPAAPELLHATPAGLDLAAAAVRFLATFFRMQATLGGYDPLAHLDAILTCAESVRRQFAALTLQGSPFAAAGPVPPRFAGHPSLQQGVAVAAGEPMCIAQCSLALSVTRFASSAGALNKRVLELLGGELLGAERFGAYMGLCSAAPMQQSRDDQALYRRRTETLWQAELCSRLLTSGSDCPASAELLALSAIASLPFGDEAVALRLVKLLLPRIAAAGTGADAVLGVGVRQGVLAFLEAHTLSADRVRRSAAQADPTDPRAASSWLFPRTTTATNRLPIPGDWLYQGMAHIAPPGRDVRAGGVEAAVQGLAFALWLERSKPEYAAGIALGRRLGHVMRVFTLTYDIYMDDQVQQSLGALYRVLAAHRTPVEFGDRIATKLFYALYQDVLHEYATMSFANPVFAKYVCLALRASFPHDFRLHAFQSEEFLATCRLRVDELAHFDLCLFPLYTNRRLLECCAIALLKRQLTAERTPALYHIAMHHLCAFVFGDVGPPDAQEAAAAAHEGDGDEAAKHRSHTITRLVLAMSDKGYRDLVYYQCTGPADIPTLPVAANTALPEQRAALLREVAAANPSVEQALRQRHASLWGP